MSYTSTTMETLVLKSIVNYPLTIATLVFGLIGWLAPGYTMNVLELATLEGSTLGMSEIRAASGALFVFAAGFALWQRQAIVFTVIGVMYAGAAVGRLTSIILDGSGHYISWSFLAVEVSFAVLLIGLNRR